MLRGWALGMLAAALLACASTGSITNERSGAVTTLEAMLVPAYYESRPPPGSRLHVWLANQPTFFRDRVCWADFSVRASHDLERLPLTVIYGRDGKVAATFVGSIERRTREFSAALTRALEARPSRRRSNPSPGREKQQPRHQHCPSG